TPTSPRSWSAPPCPSSTSATRRTTPATRPPRPARSSSPQEALLALGGDRPPEEAHEGGVLAALGRAHAPEAGGDAAPGDAVDVVGIGVDRLLQGTVLGIRGGRRGGGDAGEDLGHGRAPSDLRELQGGRRGTAALAHHRVRRQLVPAEEGPLPHALGDVVV